MPGHGYALFVKVNPSQGKPTYTGALCQQRVLCCRCQKTIACPPQSRNRQQQSASILQCHLPQRLRQPRAPRGPLCAGGRACGRPAAQRSHRCAYNQEYLRSTSSRCRWRRLPVYPVCVAPRLRADALGTRFAQQARLCWPVPKQARCSASRREQPVCRSACSLGILNTPRAWAGPCAAGVHTPGGQGPAAPAPPAPAAPRRPAASAGPPRRCDNH